MENEHRTLASQPRALLQFEPEQEEATVPAMRDEESIKAAQRAFVQKLLDQTGFNITQLARAAGLNPATLTRFMNSPVHKPNLSATTLAKLEIYAGLGNSPNISTLHVRKRTVRLRVRGIAAAGLWRDISVLDQASTEEIPVIENHRYAGRTQYALKVEGSSVNRRISDGDYAICVAWDEIGGEPQDGQYVHVERTRGGLQEVTIKMVRVLDSGSVELWQTPLDLSHPDSDTEVVIRGLVIGSFRHF
jgi:SOS-response transcriptional repressor LexA